MKFVDMESNLKLVVGVEKKQKVKPLSFGDFCTSIKVMINETKTEGKKNYLKALMENETRSSVADYQGR